MANKTKKINGMEKALFSDTERLEFWIAGNWKKYAVISVIAVVAFAAAFGIIRSLNTKKAAAEDLLADTAAEKLSAIIEQHKDLDGIAPARLRLASYLNSKKDYKGARAQYEAVISDAAADQILRDIARIALGLTLELDKDIKAAVSAFNAVNADMNASAAVRSEAAFHAARLMIVSKDLKNAEALLKREAAKSAALNNDQAAMMWVAQNSSLLAALENGDFAVKKAAPAKKDAPAKKAASAKK